MREEKVTATFQVSDQSGAVVRVREITTFETGRVIGGGAVPTGAVYRLDDGTQIEGAIGSQSFFDRRSGAAYTRV